MGLTAALANLLVYYVRIVPINLSSARYANAVLSMPHICAIIENFQQSELTNNWILHLSLG
jgi:hypothetical protein